METQLKTVLLPVQIEGETLRISSNHFAEGLGIQHKNLLESIRTHQQAIEEGFGPIAFETLKPERQSVGGRAVNIAHLTEDQALFIVTLSRNTPQVIQFKKTLVKSFSEARRMLSGQLHSPDLNRVVFQQIQAMDAQHKEQLRTLSQELNQIRASLNPFQQADVRVGESKVNDSNLKQAIVNTVNRYCETRGYSAEDTWHYVFKRLLVQNGIDARTLYRTQGASNLDALEKHGLLDKLWAIVSLDLQ